MKSKVATPKSAPIKPFHGLQVDMETLGKEHDALVVSIGLCLFSDTQIIRSTHVRVDLKDQESIGRRCDSETVIWWLNQEDARKRLAQLDAPIYLISQLHTLLRDWSHDVGNDVDLPVWACGPDFDFTILRSMFKAYHLDMPWQFYMQRDFRTIRQCINAPFVPEKKNAHDAMADAVWQANYLIQLNKELGLVQA